MHEETHSFNEPLETPKFTGWYTLEAEQVRTPIETLNKLETLGEGFTLSSDEPKLCTEEFHALYEDILEEALDIIGYTDETGELNPGVKAWTRAKNDHTVQELYTDTNTAWFFTFKWWTPSMIAATSSSSIDAWLPSNTEK